MSIHVIIKNAVTGKIGADMKAHNMRDAEKLHRSVLVQGLGEDWFVAIREVED